MRFQRWWWLYIEAVAVVLEEVAAVSAFVLVSVAVAFGMLSVLLPMGNE